MAGTVTPRGRLRDTSTASVEELELEGGGDHSLFRAGEFIHLTKCDDESFISNAYKYCQRCLGGSWAKCSADKFSVEYLHGGMTNYLYLCSLDDDIVTEDEEPRKVLIRIYGSVVDQKHRFYEGVIFTLLSERGYGPETFGVFYAGRIEEFIPHRHLFRYEMGSPDISKLIARRTAEYHCIKLPLNKNPTFLWESTQKYLEMCKGVVFEDEEDQKLYKSIKKVLDFESEYIWLKEMLLNLQSPVVFCHNDLHEGNMLYINDGNGSKTDIKLIDFDYSSYNYRGYDIANHFNEFIYEYTLGDDCGDGFIVNSDDYPSLHQQELFATEYIATLDSFRKKSMEADYDSKKFAKVISKCTVDGLLHEVNRFCLGSHFMWGLWSIVQQQVSKIDFQYLKYGKARFDEYARKKKELGY